MEYTIRKTEYTDLNKIYEMLDDLSKETIESYGMEFDPKNLKAFTGPMMNTSFVMEQDGNIVGLLAGSVSQNPATGELMYQESVWYVEKEHRGKGLKLLTFAEDYCRNNNVKFFIIGHMGSKDARLNRFYERIGFDILEIQYIKGL